MKSSDLASFASTTWRERAVALGVVAAPILVLFGPALFSDRLFAMRDAGHYYYPLFKWCADEWGAGRVPLWNPMENCGTAVHADPTASIWYPGKLIFALPLDFSVNYKLYIVGHVVLCAITAYWLARRWGGSRYAAALAALSYSCGGSVVFQHANVVYLVGAAWLPVAAGLVDDVVRQQRNASAVGLGIVLALMVLGGDPQMAYHVLLIAVLYGVVLLARRSPDSAERRQLRRSTVWGGILIATGAAVAFGLAAIQILPSAEAARESERANYDRPRSLYEASENLISTWRSSGLETRDLTEARDGLLAPPEPESHHASVYDFSVGPWRWLELIWPNVGGQMFPTHRRWLSLFPDESRIWSPTLYLGLLPLLLGLSAFHVRGGDARIRWLSWTALLFLLGSLGTYGLGWLIKYLVWYCAYVPTSFPIADGVGGVYWLFVVFLPKYVLFRYPAKLLVVASLGISQLAAVGWDRAMAEPPRRLIWMLKRLGVTSAVAAVAALIAAQFVVIGASATDPVFGPFDTHGAWSDIISSFAQAAIVSLAFAWLLEKASGGRQPPEANRTPLQLAPAAMLALCAVELTAANVWLVPTAPAELWRKPSAIAAVIGDAPDPPRLYRDAISWPASFTTRRSPQRLEELVRWERESLAGRYALLDRIGQVSINESAGAADYESIRASLVESDKYSGSIHQSRDFERLGVHYAILERNHELTAAERVVGSRMPPGTSLWKLNAPRERLQMPEDANVSVVSTSTAGLAFTGRLISMGTGPYYEITFVEGDLKLYDQPQIVQSGTPPTATIVAESPHHVTVRARLPWWNLVVLNDRYSADWKAIVTSSTAEGFSGRERPVYPTNSVFRGVYLPAGEHTIEFRYEPAAFYRGAWISGLSWATLLIGFALWRLRRRPGQ